MSIILSQKALSELVSLAARLDRGSVERPVEIRGSSKGSSPSSSAYTMADMATAATFERRLHYALQPKFQRCDGGPAIAATVGIATAPNVTSKQFENVARGGERDVSMNQATETMRQPDADARYATSIPRCGLAINVVEILSEGLKI